MELTAFGKLFSQTWALYKQRMATLATLFALPFVASVVSDLVSKGHASKATTLGNINPAVWATAGMAALLIGLVLIVISLWIQVASVYVIDGSEDKPDVKALLSKSWPLVGPYLLVAILSFLAIAGGLILLIIPGIIFAIWFAFSSFTLVLDGQRGTEALKSSKALVTGRWGAVFGRFILLGVCLLGISIVAGIVVAIFPNILGSIVNSAVSNFVISPIGLIFSYLLYKDLKAKPATTAAAAPAGPVAPTA